MKYRSNFWRRKKRKKPAKNVQDFRMLLEETIRNAVQPTEEVVISTEQMQRITWAWLYESVESAKQQHKRKRQWYYLLRLFSIPNLSELGKKLEITREEIMAALELLETLPNETPLHDEPAFFGNCP